MLVIASGLEKMEFCRQESMDFARLLLELSEEPCRGKFKPVNAASWLPWMKKNGLIDHESVFAKSGGWRLLIFRATGAESCNEIMEGFIRDTEENKSKEKKEEKEKIGGRSVGEAKCCASPRPARSKKTGKRKCMNCKSSLPGIADG